MKMPVFDGPILRARGHGNSHTVRSLRADANAPLTTAIQEKLGSSLKPVAVLSKSWS